MKPTDKFILTELGKKKSGFFRSLLDTNVSMDETEVLYYLARVNKPRTLKQIYIGLGYGGWGGSISELSKAVTKLKSKKYIKRVY